MTVISFLKAPWVENSYTFFRITIIIITTIVVSSAIHLHLRHYVFVLAFSLKVANDLTNAVASRELNTFFILELFNVTFIDQISNVRRTTIA